MSLICLVILIAGGLMMDSRRYGWIGITAIVVFAFQNCQNSEPVVDMSSSSSVKTTADNQPLDSALPACTAITDKSEYSRGETAYLCLLTNAQLNPQFNQAEIYGTYSALGPYNPVDDITSALNAGAITDRFFLASRVYQSSQLPTQLQSVSGICYAFGTTAATQTGVYSRWLYGLYEYQDSDNKVARKRVCKSNLAIITIR